MIIKIEDVLACCSIVLGQVVIVAVAPSIRRLSATAQAKMVVHRFFHALQLGCLTCWEQWRGETDSFRKEPHVRVTKKRRQKLLESRAALKLTELWSIYQRRLGARP